MNSAMRGFYIGDHVEVQLTLETSDYKPKIYYGVIVQITQSGMCGVELENSSNIYPNNKTGVFDVYWFNGYELSMSKRYIRNSKLASIGI